MLDAIAITCPFCGERYEALVDPSTGSQSYIEDCPVCCRPISMHLCMGEDGGLLDLNASRDD